MTKTKKTTKQERKIYKDFTMEEYDVFTMDMECNGAMHERTAIIAELQRRSAQFYELGMVLDLDSQTSRQMLYMAHGFRAAIKIVKKMPNLEDRCGCVECGVQ